MNLTSEQANELLTAHCYRVIDNMNSDDLFSYAVQMMMQSFDQNPGSGDTDLEMLVEDIWVAEGEDEDSAQEFIAGVVGNDLAEEIVKSTQFWLLTMETTYDFVDLETEWQDDLLIPAADDDESESNFRQFINSNIDFWIIMSKALLISMLRKGQTGNEILSILNMLADESDDTMSEPTLDEIEFWLVLLIIQGLDRLSPIL